MSIRSQLDAPNPFQTLSDIFSRLCSLFRTHSPAEPWKASTKPKPIPEIKAYYEAHMLKWLEAVADATKPQKPPGAAVVREAVVRR